MKYILITILLVLISCSGQENEQKEYFLIPYQVGEKWGLADTLGNLRVNPVYDEVLDFNIYSRGSKSLYYVRTGNKIKLIDASENEYLQDYDITYDRIGQRPVFSKKGKKGKLLQNYDEQKSSFYWTESLPFEYDSIYSSEDRGYDIIVKEGKKGLITALTNRPLLLIPVEYDSIAFINKNEWEIYNLDKNGEIVSSQTYERGNETSPLMGLQEDPVIVKISEPAIFNKRLLTQKEKSRFNIDELDEYNMFYYPPYLNWIIIENNKKYNLIKRSKMPNEIIDFKYDTIYMVEYLHNPENLKQREMAFVMKAQNRYKILSEFSSEVAPLKQYDLIEQRYYNKSLSDRDSIILPYLVFKKDDKYGVDTFNSNFEVINQIPFEFDEILDRDIVVKNNKYGIYDLMRNIKIDPKYLEKPKEIKRFSGKRSWKSYLYECVNEEGKKILVYRNGVEMYKKE